MTPFRTAALGLGALLTIPLAAVAQDTGAQTAATDRITAADAIAAAKGHVDGGVLEAELEKHRDGLVWEIDIAGSDGVTEVIVDAATGEVRSADEKTIEGAWRSWFDGDRLTVAREAGSGLGEWLAAAESQIGGHVTEISLDEEDGRLAYELEVETPSGERDAYIDAATGEVVLGEFD